MFLVNFQQYIFKIFSLGTGYIEKNSGYCPLNCSHRMSNVDDPPDVPPVGLECPPQCPLKDFSVLGGMDWGVISNRPRPEFWPRPSRVWIFVAEADAEADADFGRFYAFF